MKSLSKIAHKIEGKNESKKRYKGGSQEFRVQEPSEVGQERRERGYGSKEKVYKHFIRNVHLLTACLGPSNRLVGRGGDIGGRCEESECKRLGSTVKITRP